MTDSRRIANGSAKNLVGSAACEFHFATRKPVGLALRPKGMFALGTTSIGGMLAQPGACRTASGSALGRRPPRGRRYTVLIGSCRRLWGASAATLDRDIAANFDAGAAAGMATLGLLVDEL